MRIDKGTYNEGVHEIMREIFKDHEKELDQL